MRAFKVVVVAACGDNGGGGVPDAPKPPVDVAIDAREIDASQLACNHTEAQDATNNDADGEPVADVIGGAPYVICGQFDPHLQSGLVDQDGFKVSFASTASSTVRVFVPDTTGLTRVDGFTNDVAQTNTFGVGRLQGNHLAYILDHPTATEYVIYVSASAAAATTAAIPYKILVTPGGSPCPAITGAPAYTEAHDGTGNTDNDTFTRDSLRFRYTAATTDTPEPTGLEVAATPLRISGTHAAVSNVDLFDDRDAYAITSGATTNELAVRLTSADATRFVWLAAFIPDEIVQPQNEAPPLADTNRTGVILFAVEPNKPYLLFAGMLGAAGNPTTTTYDLAICGDSVAPP